jgi:hypothetical protein
MMEMEKDAGAVTFVLEEKFVWLEDPRWKSDDGYVMHAALYSDSTDSLGWPLTH